MTFPKGSFAFKLGPESYVCDLNTKVEFNRWTAFIDKVYTAELAKPKEPKKTLEPPVKKAPAAAGSRAPVVPPKPKAASNTSKKASSTQATTQSTQATTQATTQSTQATQAIF